MYPSIFPHIVLLVFLLLTAAATSADEIKVAVASNFKETIRELARQFEASSPHKLNLIFASTGKHYAQIKHGAPFDVFLAADDKRPALLEQQGMSLMGSRFTYAVGRLALWNPQNSNEQQWDTVLAEGAFRHIALANPKHAPYGMAAKEVLQKKNLWQKLRPKLVKGENVAQAFQFIKTGNAQLGFVAYAQIKALPTGSSGTAWLIPQELYAPIQQQAVVLRDSDAVTDFIRYLHSTPALKLIRRFGYDTP